MIVRVCHIFFVQLKDTLLIKIDCKFIIDQYRVNINKGISSDRLVKSYGKFSQCECSKVENEIRRIGSSEGNILARGGK